MKQQPVAVNDGSASTSLAELTDVLFITVFFNKKTININLRTFWAVPVYILCISSFENSHGQISEKLQSKLYLFIDKGEYEKVMPGYTTTF